MFVWPECPLRQHLIKNVPVSVPAMELHHFLLLKLLFLLNRILLSFFSFSFFFLEGGVEEWALYFYFLVLLGVFILEMWLMYQTAIRLLVMMMFVVIISVETIVHGGWYR